MGILARFGRRNDRDRVLLKHNPAKHKIAKRAQSRSSPKMTISNFLDIPSRTLEGAKQLLEKKKKNGLGCVVHVDNITATIIRNEVTTLLRSNSNHRCTVLELANSLAQNQACLESHSKINERHPGYSINTFVRKLGQNETVSVRAGNLLNRSMFSRKMERESMRFRYQWINALNRLERSPSSRDQIIFTWEEAKKSLEGVISFPSDLLSSDENLGDQDREESRVKAPSSADKERFGVDKEIKIVEENVNSLSISNAKWIQIASYPEQRKLESKLKEGSRTSEEQEDLEILKQKNNFDKADLCFNARIRTQEELTDKIRERDNEFVKKLEERRNLIEAKKRASSLMRTLDDDERKIVQNAIHGNGHGDEIIAQAGTDSVRRTSMKTLKPGLWLNDEIIHYFYLMLAKRDEELCKNDSTRKRSHFFKSFFITKLLNEGNTSCDGKYEYKNVKRWSKKVPGKDIFNLDKILFPINMGNMHWICAVIFMEKKRIEIFDSMGSNGNRYLDALFNYVQDEHLDKKKSPLPDADSWELVPTQQNTPRQANGHDCGVFTCMFADFLSKDTALVFNQDHIDQCRERIALSIMKGKAIM